MKRIMSLLSAVCSVTLMGSINAAPLVLLTTDPAFDQLGASPDLVHMSFAFDNATGNYVIELKATNENPFLGDFRVNINLFNLDVGTTAMDPSFFNDTLNDFSLTAPTTTLSLTGNDSRLISWNAGDRIMLNNFPDGSPSPDGATLFRSGVGVVSSGDVATNEDMLGIQSQIDIVGEVQAEVLDLKIEKLVDNPVPIGAQPVEFTIVVTNVGEKPATGVIVEDRLPQGLAIPDGLAAFTSSGDYDSSKGLWVVGDIAVGEEEIMTLPAVVTATPQPACIINSAKLLAPDDASSRNDVASAAVMLPVIERCADVSISSIYGPTTTPLCGDQRMITRQFAVTNNGPDEARNVVLTVSETAYKAPGFALVSPGCSGLVCNWPSISAGERVEVSAFSDLFFNTQTLEHSVTATVTTSDGDYLPENNVASDGGTIDPFTGDCGLPDYGAEGGGGGVSLCFIATAAYGTPFDERLDKLRHFRDHTLARFAAGRVFIDWYYSYSPPLAKYIEPRPVLRAIVRALLVPVLFAIDNPIAALAVWVMGIFLLLISWRAFVLRRTRAGKTRQAAGIELVDSDKLISH